jgi:hypothetical protein
MGLVGTTPPLRRFRDENYVMQNSGDRLAFAPACHQGYRCCGSPLIVMCQLWNDAQVLAAFRIGTLPFLVSGDRSPRESYHALIWPAVKNSPSFASQSLLGRPTCARIPARVSSEATWRSHPLCSSDAVCFRNKPSTASSVRLVAASRP